ncbi:MAG: hypothetical protein ABIK62_04545 [candidate division WOR-3 bacterium]
MAEEIHDATVTAYYHYRESDESGRITKVVTGERNVTISQFHEQRHQFRWLEVNGRRLNDAELRRELIPWRIQELAIRETKLPFTPAHRSAYRFFAAGRDTWHGTTCWRIGFAPTRRGLGYLRGDALINPADSNVIRLCFTPASRPPLVSDLRLRLDYGAIRGYWLPTSFVMQLEVTLKLVHTLVHRHIWIQEDYSDYSFNVPRGRSQIESPAR